MATEGLKLSESLFDVHPSFDRSMVLFDDTFARVFLSTNAYQFARKVLSGLRIPIWRWVQLHWRNKRVSTWTTRALYVNHDALTRRSPYQSNHVAANNPGGEHEETIELP